MQNPVYLDYNATTPIDPEVRQAMLPFLEGWFGNPSSNHSYGVQTRKAVEKAREQVAALLHCRPDEIVFTSGGTEANNWALKGVALQNQHKGNHIITTAIEHPAITEVCEFLKTQGFRITYTEVDSYGRVHPENILKHITPQTILISIMHANNEVGTLQPIEEIGSIARQKGIIFHSDAAQSAGKIPTDVNIMGVDLLTLAGHKFYAPKGVGALYIRRGVKLQKLLHGASHEQNLRAGTENILEIAGLGKAAEIALRDLPYNQKVMQATRDQLFSLIKEAIPQVQLNGHPQLHLPNTLSMGFPGVEANILLDEIRQIAASAGAACHSDKIEISHVLQAMGIPLEYAMGTIRFSTGKQTTHEEIAKAAEIIIEAAKKLMPGNEPYNPPLQGTRETIKLTHYTQGLGCACKIRPGYLEQVLSVLPQVFDKNVLVGINTSDDAAVYKISEEIALVQTLDFFTPVVDDPYTFGAIAAANALSDIYAMGAQPLFGLNIAGFPSNRLPMQVLKDILKGASDKAAEAGICILGGHTIDDPEPKFGMVISGITHPHRILTNATAQPGDALLLTKPIGTGIIATALKKGLADESVAKAAEAVMTALNKTAAEVMRQFPVNACTDITGFGLLGHLREMMDASQTSASIQSADIPLIEGVEKLAHSGSVPGGTRNNLEFSHTHIEWPEDMPEIVKLILCDAQTSGGLLIALPADRATEMQQKLIEAGVREAALIGFVETRQSKAIRVV